MIVNKQESEINELLLKDDSTIEEKITKELDMDHVKIEFKYIDSYETNTADLIVLIEKIVAKYKQKENENNDGKTYKLAAIFVDYLDLIKPVVNTDLYRLELGHVTMELKKLSIRYMVPLITLTQVNDYTLEKLCEHGYSTPRLDLLSESKKKVENADCVIILHSNWFITRKKIVNTNADIILDENKFLDERIVCLSVIKNRGYRKGAFNVYVNFTTRRMYCLGNSPESEDMNEYLELGYETPKYFERKIDAKFSDISNNFNSIPSSSSSNNSRNNYFF